MDTYRKRRRQLIRAGGALAGVSAFGLPYLARAQQKTIRIGYVSPQTGPLAPFGEADNFTLSQIRARLKDGLTVAGAKYAVEILVKDSQSNPNRAGEVAAD